MIGGVGHEALWEFVQGYGDGCLETSLGVRVVSDVVMVINDFDLLIFFAFSQFQKRLYG